MKAFKSSALTNTKRCEVFEEAEKNGVIIQMCKTNGNVIKEFILLSSDSKYLVQETEVNL